MFKTPLHYFWFWEKFLISPSHRLWRRKDQDEENRIFKIWVSRRRSHGVCAFSATSDSNDGARLENMVSLMPQPLVCSWITWMLINYSLTKPSDTDSLHVCIRRYKSSAESTLRKPRLKPSHSQCGPCSPGSASPGTFLELHGLLGPAAS